MADRLYLGGMTNTVIHGESDGSLVIEERQDAQAILESNQRKRDHRYSANSPSGFFREVADIPMVVYQEKCRQIGQQLFAEPDVAMELILNDPQFSNLLTAPKTRDPRIIMTGNR